MKFEDLKKFLFEKKYQHLIEPNVLAYFEELKSRSSSRFFIGKSERFGYFILKEDESGLIPFWCEREKDKLDLLIDFLEFEEPTYNKVLKVQTYRPTGKNKELPKILLSGEYLKEAGYEPGDKFFVEVNKATSQIIITKKESEDE